MKIEHIGIAVKDIEASEQLYKDLFKLDPYKRELVPSEGVEVSFFDCGESKIELLSSTNENSSIEKFIQSKGEGVHHIAYLVDDLVSEMKRLSGLGYSLIEGYPKLGADDKRVAFLHPKSTQGVLIELCECI